MELQPVDGTKLLVLMIAGGVIAAVGLYLMLRPKPEDAAKIEIFGLKFESSSAGLVVFVIGAAFLAVPLFAPERIDRAAAGPDVNVGGSIDQATTARATIENGQGGATVPVGPPSAHPPAETSLEEAEPNDTIGSANVIVPGQILSGSVKDYQIDWVAIDVSAATNPVELRVRRSNRMSSPLIVRLLDAREQEVGKVAVADSTQIFELNAAQHAMYFLQISPESHRAYATQYEVLLDEFGTK